MKKITGRLKRWYRKRFQNYNHVFRHDGPFEPAGHAECRFERYERVEDVPERVWEAIRARGGGKRVTDIDQRELADGAMMWIAMIGDEPAGELFTRRGGQYRSWFVPLDERDVVIFRVRTSSAFRGRGIAPALMRRVMHELLADGGTAYIDCRVYNYPSIRSIEKAGFTKIATMKPISRHEALEIASAL